MRFVLVSDSVSAFEEVATRNNVLLLPTQSQENMRYLITRHMQGWLSMAIFLVQAG